MSSKLILNRKNEWFNKRKDYLVLIDGNQAGIIRNDSTEEYTLEPGTHTVQCKINWMSSPETSFTVTEGSKVYLQVKGGMKFFMPLYILLFIGILFPLYFTFSHLPTPQLTGVIKIFLIFPWLIYMLLYLTVLRKKYLFLGEDTSNPFK